MSETRVNSNTAGDQSNPQVIQLANGNHLVAWSSGGQTAGQLFAVSGAPIGGNFVLTSGRSPVEFSVTPLSDGGFLAAWTSLPSSGSAGDIAVQRFEAGGARVGGAIQVASSPTDDAAPAITAIEGGGFAVAWVEKTQGSFQTDLKLQIFGAGGAPSTAAMTVDTFQMTGGGAVQLYPRHPTITQLDDGQIVLAWAKSGHGYHGYVQGDVLIQRFDPSGQAVGPRIVSDGFDPNRAHTVVQPSVVATSDGGFAVAWQQQEGYAPAQPTTFSTAVRKYAADGALEGSWTKDTGDWRSTADLTANPDGGFTLAYSGSSTSEVYLQAFNADAAPVGDAVLVNTTTAGVQNQADVARLGDGGYAVAWRSDDGDQGGVYLSKVGGSGPSPGEGRVIDSRGPGDTLVGGSGDDTLNASQGPDVLTGGGGGDIFAWAREPWSPAKVTDFTLGEDRLDLSALFQAAGYTGSDPVADKYISFVGVAGGTGILFDRDGAGPSPQWANYIINLQGVHPYQVTWGQLSGAAAPPAFSLAGSVSQAEGDTGLTSFTFTVTRSGSTADPGAVYWAVHGAGANPASASDFSGGVDGRPPGAWLQFAAGETSKTITINVVGDTAVEPDEGFTVDLLSSNGGSTGAQKQATGTILNDDAGSPPPNDGQVINSPGPGSTLTGGAGDDTLNASRGEDVLTGDGGADVFAWAQEPWAPARVTDFAVGVDRLDLSAVFQAAGYTGSDPEADGRIVLMDRGGDTLVLFDDDGPGGDWPNYIITLEGVQHAGLTWAQLAAGGEPAGEEGQVLTSDQYGDTLIGGAGNDTLNAGRGPDQLTGAGGADRFAWADLPWNAGRVTDFAPGTDVLDLSRLLAGYGGSDPVRDGYLEFRADGLGNTQVYVDHDGPNAGDWPFLITTLDGVSPGQIGAGDWIA